jgi:hypothetical protein
MDVITTAQLIPVLSPMLNGIMEGVGGQLWESLTRLVGHRREEQPQLASAMQAVANRSADKASVNTLAAVLEMVSRADPEFASQLRDWYLQAPKPVSARTTINSNSGTVTGPLIQAEEIHGGITFGAHSADGTS